MEITTLVVGAIIGVFIGGILVWFVLKKKQEKYAFKVVKDAQEESQNILKQAKVEAENIKKEKIYQAKEKFLELKSEHEKLILSKEKKLFQVGHSKASKYKIYVVSEGSIYIFIRPSAEWVLLDNAESRSLMSKIYSKGIVYCDDETIEKLATKLPKSFLEMIQ